MARRALVTGATGFIGSCLARQLVADQQEVHVLARKGSNRWRINDISEHITEHAVDLRDEDGVKKCVREIQPSVIYHLATYGAHPYETDHVQIMSSNLLGTMSLVEACIKEGFDCFVNMGSSSEYGQKDKPMKENDILEPVDYYGVSKAAATLLCGCVARRTDFAIFTIRPFAVYGYYEAPSRLIPTIIRACLEGRNPELLSPDSVRDFIFVEDVVGAIIELVHVVLGRASEISGQVFNVGSGKQHTVGEVAQKIIELAQADVQPLWSHAPSRDRIEPSMWISDSSKINNLLNWKPRFELTDGLQKTLEWFRDNIGLYQSVFAEGARDKSSGNK
jgi:nucleoside-diphosphate-sugar epimerase